MKPETDPVEFIYVEDLTRLPAKISGTRPFVLLLAMDADYTPPDIIELVATQLLNRGLAYFGAWGPSCERVHEVFDRSVERLEDAVGHELPMVSIVSHEDDDLKDAIWEFLNIYWPDEAFENPRWIAAAVGEKRLGERVKSMLPKSDAPRLK